MEVILIKAAQFILSLTILVTLHEMGHFFAAKFFKIKVDKFYIFFNPWFSLFKKKIGDTEYGLGWLPLGGYVKIAGMIDESMDKEQMEKPPEPWEYRSKPAWQRLVVITAGVIVNFVLAMVIYSMIMMVWGDQYISMKKTKYGIVTNEVGLDLGLQNGDKIISIDGYKPERMGEIFEKVILGKEVIVDRNGQIIKLAVTDEFKGSVVNNKKRLEVRPRMAFVVSEVIKGSGAEKAGMKSGDELSKINGNPVMFIDEATDILKENKNKSIDLEVIRGDDLVTLTAQVSDDAKLGVGLALDKTILASKKYGFLESIPAGTVKAANKLSSYVKQFGLLFNSETKAYKSLGGFKSIGNLFPGTWDWRAFWELTAFLSVMLAFMNILPIPALDGGHAVFIIWEMITGKAPSQKVLEYAQMVGFLLLITMMIVANGNDFGLFSWLD